MKESKSQWRLSFRLRTLFVVVAVLGTILGLLGNEWRYLRREAIAAKELETLGAEIVPEGVGEEVAWWHKLRWAILGKRVEEIYLSDTSITDLTPLTAFKHLRVVHLDGTEVSDITPLFGLKNLDWVVLANSKVSDEQVQAFRKAFPECEVSVDLPTQSGKTF
jgi:Leucine-rich repeat (LRR) protein